MHSHLQLDFFVPLIVAAAITCATILLHGLTLAAIVQFVRRERRLGYAGFRFSRNVVVVTAVTMLALTAHMLEIALWAWVYELCAEFSTFAAAFYASAENYTTLGYGDVVMSARWRLLGPLEAADGMLMFGVSTAMIFTIIQRLIQARLHDSSV